MPDAERFARGLEGYNALRARDDGSIAPGAGSRLLHHGRSTGRVVLLLHGLTASPPQFSAIADHCYARGDTVLVPRLPRHGNVDRMTEELRELDERELTDAARNAHAIAADLGARLTVAGISLGGLLSLWLAQHRQCASAVAIAPFLGIIGLPRRFSPACAGLVLRAPNRFLWWDPFRREQLGPAYGYPRYPTHAVARIFKLVHDLGIVAARESPRTRHITLVTNRGETTIQNAASRRLAADWRRYPGITVNEISVRGLGPSHDIVEPLRAPHLFRRAFPQLIAALG